MRLLPWICIAVAICVGIGVELGIGKPGKESWDNEAYWTLGLPAMIGAAFVLGIAARRMPVVIGYAPFAGQLVTMLWETGAGSMLPLGVMLMGIMGAPAVAAAFAGASLGRRVLK